MYPTRRSAPEVTANIRNGKKPVALETLNNSIKPCAPPGNESDMKPNGSLIRESAIITPPVTQAWPTISDTVSDALSESSFPRGNVPIKQAGTSNVTYKSSIVNRGLINQRIKRKKNAMRLDRNTTMMPRPSLGNTGLAAKTANEVKAYTHTRAAAITMANDNRLEDKSNNPMHISVKRGLRVLKKI
jgi:hypothetical protein